MLEVENVRDVVRLSVAHRERLQVPSPLDHLQDRRVVVDRVRDVATSRIGRDDKTRHAKAAQRIARIDVRRRRWRHVVEEPSPLVEVDHQHRARPVRACRHGAVDAREEPFTDADVGVRVIVPRSSLVGAGEDRVDERDPR